MLHNLPQQYRQDPWILTLVNAMEGEMAAQQAETASIVAQMSLDTVTWLLEVEERIAGIAPAPGATLDERRSALKAKWRSGGKIGLEQIQAVADAWKNGEVSVEFVQGRIKIHFIGAYGVPTDLAGLERAIGLAVPAHLPVDYLLNYLLIRNIHEVMTVDELQAQPLGTFAF